MKESSPVELARVHLEWLRELRRDLHRHPEPSWAEYRTTARVVRELEMMGFDPIRFEGIPGAVCDVVTGTGPCVALRADLDALPIADQKDVPYASQVPQVCHACGHDVHTAVLLGAARILADAQVAAGAGTVRLIFQPAEEAMPGGARRVVAAGVLEGVDAVYALHCDPTLEVGSFGVADGPVTSAADRIRITLRGPGGHTARPHLTTDLVHTVGQVITQVPAALGRLTDQRDAASLVFGHVEAGGAPNVIPAEAVVEGTFRTRERRAWDAAPALIERLVAAQADTFGAEWEVDHQRGNPPVENDPRRAAIARRALVGIAGAERVRPAAQSLGSEDFSWLLDEVPGCYVRLGVASPARCPGPDLHRGEFDVDEDALVWGSAALAAIAWEELDGTRA